MHYKIIRISRELFPKFLTLWIDICRGGVLPAIINGYLFAYFSDPVNVCNMAGSERPLFMPRDRDHQEY